MQIVARLLILIAVSMLVLPASWRANCCVSVATAAVQDEAVPCHGHAVDTPAVPDEQPDYTDCRCAACSCRPPAAVALLHSADPMLAPVYRPRPQHTPLAQRAPIPPTPPPIA